METVEKAKDRSVRKKKSVRKIYKLSDFLGCFKGRIFYDEDIFNFAK